MADPLGLFDLTGRVACVTGASLGRGWRAAVALAAASAQVVGVARRAALNDSLVGETSGVSVVARIAERAGLTALVEKINAPFGGPDMVVHCASINTREAADDVTLQGWDQTLALNLTAPCCF